MSTLQPGGFSGANTTAEIVVHPSGKFVYGSNRGKNSIAVFTVNAGDGMLTAVQQQTTGATPRNFAIDPTGAFCIVAGQGSGDIRLYTIHPEHGQLTDTGKKLSVSAPVCIVPFILQPPQPVITTRATGKNRFELGIGNSLDLLTYQVYRATAVSPTASWNLLATGGRGQTNFLLTNRFSCCYPQTRLKFANAAINVGRTNPQRIKGYPSSAAHCLRRCIIFASLRISSFTC